MQIDFSTPLHFNVAHIVWFALSLYSLRQNAIKHGKWQYVDEKGEVAKPLLFIVTFLLIAIYSVCLYWPMGFLDNGFQLPQLVFYGLILGQIAHHIKEGKHKVNIYRTVCWWTMTTSLLYLGGAFTNGIMPFTQS